MQMHQQKSEQQQQQIGGQSSDICISADLSTPQNTNQKQTHLHIQIPQTQTELNHETLLSTPHKRPIMIQTTSHSPAFSSHTNHHKKSSNLESSSHSLSCCSFARKLFAHKFVQNVYRVCFLRFHLRFLILLPLPSLYFFFTNAHRFLVLNFLFVLAFVVTLLLLSLNLALPRLPSLRSLLSRSLPINLTPLLSTSSSVKPLKPVVWSIGSKPKLAKNPNSGSWVYVYNNGDVYEGEFHRGKSSGSGVYYYFKKGRYEGDWIDGKYDGYGVETWARGSRYRGIFRQGLRHGIGLYRSYTGDIYAGEWSNGQCHGCGVHTCEDGSRYIGEFKWGVKHGLGYYQFRNGDVYSGEYFADRMHGFGVYQFANGHRYEGAWHEGRRQGLGMYTFRNGETQSGHWQNGVLDVSSLQNSDSAHPFAVSHSKVLNAVQEAQRAAARAYDVARVDERVNKAMVAANKAANAARVAAVKAVQNQMHQNNNDDVQIPIV